MYVSRIGHVQGGGGARLRDGGPISYEPRPAAFFQPAPPGTWPIRETYTLVLECLSGEPSFIQAERLS